MEKQGKKLRLARCPVVKQPKVATLMPLESADEKQRIGKWD